MDTAFVCFSLIINTPLKNNDFEQKKRMVEAYNKSGIIYYFMCDYQNAYELLIKALLLCERYDYPEYEPRIFTNIGNIYYRFNKPEIAKSYFLKALELCKDSITVVILNNLGLIEVNHGKQDSAKYYLTKSLQLSKNYNNLYVSEILNSIGAFYQKNNLFDSAFYYYRLSLYEATKNNKTTHKIMNLSDIGKLYFKINELDSAVFYINLSNKEAMVSNFPRILAENYLTLSKIDESKGLKTTALEYYKQYADLKDTVFSVEKFADINQLQRGYEISKTNAQIEQLVIEKHYQKIIWRVTFVILLVVSAALLLLSIQNKRLNTAYKTLFNKNIKIIEMQKSPNSDTEKYQKSALTDEMQEELLDKILTIMEDTAVICAPEFSLDRLAELVQSNYTYVSQVINTALNKNFRSFLNSYRIHEAQRLFSELDLTKYTIAAIANEVGFKSPAAFRKTFKEITGVSPNFYLKAMQKQRG
jgi:AraC-like DNA-binding protein